MNEPLERAMHRTRVALLSLSYALFVASFFLPTAHVPHMDESFNPMPGWQAAEWTSLLAVDTIKTELQALLGSGGLSQDAGPLVGSLLGGSLLFGLGHALMLGGNIYMVITPWIVLRKNCRLLLASRVASIIVTGGALQPLLVPGIVLLESRTELLIGYYAWLLSFVIMLIVTFFPAQKKVAPALQSGAPLKSPIIIAFVFALGLPASARDYNEVYYLCADWGPAMKMPTKEGEKPRFSDTEEEVYFLKQVTGVKREKLSTPNIFTGSKEREAWTGRSIYLCKMKPDGTAKTEIKELWRDPNFPIDVQGQATWMDINEKMRKIALAITFAGNEITGLWTMNLDGSDLKRIISPENNDKYLQAVNHPSWHPDGQWIVFEEELRGADPNRFRIARCDPDGKNILRFTDDARDEKPSFSPDGKQIVYVHGINWGSLLWLMDVDGKNQRALLNPKGKLIGGTWPAWSPDGKQVYLLSAGIIEVATGKVISECRPLLDGKPWPAGATHWGTRGLLGSANSFNISLTDTEQSTMKLLCVSGNEDAPKGK